MSKSEAADDDSCKSGRSIGRRIFNSCLLEGCGTSWSCLSRAV